MSLVDYVIMAQGPAKRWRELNNDDENIIDIPKQALPIGNKTNIQRIIDMFRSFGNVHIVCDGTMFEYFNRNSVDRVLTLNGNPGTLLRGIHIILTHKFVSSERVVFLLGDVIFSHRMVELISRNMDDFPTLFGRTGSNEVTGKFAPELFALSVGSDWFSLVSTASFDIWQKKDAIKHDAKLWDLEHDFSFPVLALNSDYTDDVDSIQEYDKFYGILKREAEKDDKNWATII